MMKIYKVEAKDKDKEALVVAETISDALNRYLKSYPNESNIISISKWSGAESFEVLVNKEEK